MDACQSCRKGAFHCAFKALLRHDFRVRMSAKYFRSIVIARVWINPPSVLVADVQQLHQHAVLFCFRSQTVSRIAVTIAEKGSITKQLSKACSDRPIVGFNYFKDACVRVLCRVVFGLRPSQIKAVAHRVVQGGRA